MGTTDLLKTLDPIIVEIMKKTPQKEGYDIHELELLQALVDIRVKLSEAWKK